MGNYEKIFFKGQAESQEDISLQMLKSYVPQYYGQVEENGEKKIEIENLLHKAPNASFMDIKLGTSTITLNTAAKGQSEIERRTAKDKTTTSGELGYTVCGLCKKNEETGAVIESHYKMFPPKDKIPEAFRSIFTCKDSLMPNNGGIKGIKSQLQRLLQYFTDVNEHEIRGASIFIVVSMDYCDVKLIDLGSFKPLGTVENYDGTSRDPGMILGIQNVIAMLD